MLHCRTRPDDDEEDDDEEDLGEDQMALEEEEPVEGMVVAHRQSSSSSCSSSSSSSFTPQQTKPLIYLLAWMFLGSYAVDAFGAAPCMLLCTDAKALDEHAKRSDGPDVSTDNSRGTNTAAAIAAAAAANKATELAIDKRAVKCAEKKHKLSVSQFQFEAQTRMLEMLERQRDNAAASGNNQAKHKWEALINDAVSDMMKRAKTSFDMNDDDDGDDDEKENKNTRRR